MMELGAYAEKEHTNMLVLVQALGFKEVHFVGAQFYTLKNQVYRFWNTAAELVEYFKSNPPKDATILFKGSRRNKLETVAEVL
jgi:UDP-N-acetylmuramyl pentapeptide synthase